jgi:hypothetical protein
VNKVYSQIFFSLPYHSGFALYDWAVRLVTSLVCCS